MVDLLQSTLMQQDTRFENEVIFIFWKVVAVVVAGYIDNQIWERKIQLCVGNTRLEYDGRLLI